MAARRFGPLIVLVLAGAVVVLVRLFQIQVVQHEVWANQAANLVRSGGVVPYRRGEITDAEGRMLARDEDVYRIDFRYREFRRHHPLGQVAHAWSAIEMRPVPLSEALEQLVPAALALAQLTHAELDGFARGEELARGPLEAPASDDPSRDFRRSRRADVRYYIGQLIGLDRRQALQAARDEDSPSLLEFAARTRKLADAGVLLDELATRLERSTEDLGRLAELLANEDSDSELYRNPETDLTALVGRLEGWRRDVENATASELFREATGFSAGRVLPHTLQRRFDLRWLATLLSWDASRVAAWTETSRGAWNDALENWHLRRLRLEADFATREGRVPDVILDGWSDLYLEPASGGGPRALQVFSELDSLFAMPVPRELRREQWSVLPVQEELPRPASFEDLARLESWSPEGAPHEEVVSGLAEDWRAAFAEGSDGDWVEERTRAVLATWEAHFQHMLAAQLRALAAVAPPPSPASERAEAMEGATRLPLADGRLDRAEERARSVLKDRGSRPFVVEQRPDYSLVHLLTRYPRDFAGFVVHDATERQRLSDARGVVFAHALLGTVREPGMREMMSQREIADQLAELLRQGVRNEEEDQRLETYVKQVSRVDELRGGDGIEGHYERQLAGRNGYRELRGLQEIRSGSSGSDSLDVPPVDGQRVQLTLDLELQRAAQETLASPAEDPEPARRDYDWLLRPTGAIVLIRPNGDVLAAASYPDQRRGTDETPSMRDLPLERTLRRPGFQPAGSVFKPFVAAWALDNLDYDPMELVGCFALEDGSGAGWIDLRCWREWGHGEVNLHGALKDSCNGYFAWLGEQYTFEQLGVMAREFGFGQPTGVRTEEGLGGLREDAFPQLLTGAPFGRARTYRMAGNGLGVIEVTPMQVARAYAGLATGRLPELRLVQSVGAKELPGASRAIDVSRAALERVRAALFDVTNGGGTAEEALSREQIGFAMSAKTGSADIASKAVVMADGGRRVRKHTWIAGWFPPEDPVAVLVVFVDDTLVTSSHSSAWIARQFLRRPEVQQYFQAELQGTAREVDEDR
jgi:penicillin-binding protein 2